MSESDQTETAGALIDSLRAAGTHRFDPVRWRYIEVLAERAVEHESSVKSMLDAKLTHALAVLKERFELAQSEAKEILTLNVQQYPHAANDLQRHFDSGDFKGLQLLIATLKTREQCESLAALVRKLEEATPENIDARSVAHTDPYPELKTIRHFRDTWSKLSVDKQVTRALEQAPKNAGPINSHMLVLRSLELMRDISPDYLNRFMSYAETLLSLDQGENEKPANSKKPQAAKAAKK